MKDRLTVVLHPCTNVDPKCATDQMAIYLDGDLLIGYASTVEDGGISLIATFADADVPLIREAVSELVGVNHGAVGMVPDVPDDILDSWSDDDLEIDDTDTGSLNDDDSE